MPPTHTCTLSKNVLLLLRFISLTLKKVSQIQTDSVHLSRKAVRSFPQYFFFPSKIQGSIPKELLEKYKACSLTGNSKECCFPSLYLIFTYFRCHFLLQMLPATGSLNAFFFFFSFRMPSPFVLILSEADSGHHLFHSLIY